MLDQRWEISPASEEVYKLSQATGFSPLVAQIFINRGFATVDSANLFINPDRLILPSPEQEFKDLEIALSLLTEAINNQEKIAICGDYDADGMTSTALLIRALRVMGADVDYSIPDRHKDGYGINERIVKQFAEEGVGLIITVDNGISAVGAIDLARELGLDIIITDHHDLPEKLPDANAILNPKLLDENSPYYGLAGVGVAYILALSLVEQFKIDNLSDQLLELFTLGTIADLAPLIGINRYLLKKGLRLLPNSEITGIQALMQMAGISEEQIKLQSEDIGFKLGPRINAIGRIDNPQIVIELLTTSDKGLALERAMQCEQANTKRQQLCQEIQEQAIAIIEGKEESNLVPKHFLDWKKSRVLVIGNRGWHHGVIGIVASRLVDHYGVPVFICTSEDDTKIRGSARGIKEYNVFEALTFCQETLGKFGGHKMAGGFSLDLENLENFQQGLSEFSSNILTPDLLKPLIEIDGIAKISEITPNLYAEIDSLYPWGIGNREPIFLSQNVIIKEQKSVKNNHAKFTLEQNGAEIKGIAWHWAQYLPFPSLVDIAYKLKENNFNGETSIEIEIVGIKYPENVTEKIPAIVTENQPINEVKKAKFSYNNRFYYCSLWESLNELRIKNDQGKVLAVKKGEKVGLLGTSRDNSTPIDVTKPPYFSLIKAAKKALNI
jgi:single-stranded-DNA-specific exonuclease